MLEATTMGNLGAMANTIGQMEVFSKVTFIMGSDMEMESGKEVLENLISMRGSTRMIKSVDMVYLLGLVETSTREIILMT